MRTQVSLPAYVENALYGPTGYYSSGQVKFGPDFETFGEKWAPLLANRFLLAWQAMVKHGEIQKSEVFRIYEFGAGEGKMALMMLKYIHGRALLYPHSEWVDFYNIIQYIIGEISPKLIEKQQQILADYLHYKKVSIFKSDARRINNAIPSGPGIVVTNELIDAFPPHEITLTEHGLFATVVITENGKSTPHKVPADEVLSPKELAFVKRTIEHSAQIINQYPIVFCAHPDIMDFYANVSHILTRGYVFTLDYGFDGLFNIYKGSDYQQIRTYSGKHGKNASPFKHSGEVDITADINFSDMELAGRDYDMELAGFYMQDSLGGNIIEAFRVLIQRKQVSADCDKYVCAGLKQTSEVRYEEMPALMSMIATGTKLITDIELYHESVMAIVKNDIINDAELEKMRIEFMLLHSALEKLFGWLHSTDYAKRDRSYITLLNELICIRMLELSEIANYFLNIKDKDNLPAKAIYGQNLLAMLSDIAFDDKNAEILLTAIAGHMQVMINEPSIDCHFTPGEIQKNRNLLIYLLIKHHKDMAYKILNNKTDEDYNFGRARSETDEKSSLLNRCLSAAESRNHIAAAMNFRLHTLFQPIKMIDNANNCSSVQRFC